MNGDKSLKILFVEDSAEDMELAKRALRSAGYALTVRRVQDRPGLLRELNLFEPELVISDYTMPGFNGLEALAVCRMKRPEMPFLFLSGGIGEDRAVEALRFGAIDYILKDRMARLAPCVQRALREVQDRRENRRMEREYFRFFNSSQHLFCIAGFDGRFKQLNPAWEAALGFSIEEIMARPFIEMVHPDDKERSAKAFQRLMNGEDPGGFENRIVCRDGSYRLLAWNCGVDLEERLIYAAARDVTEQRRQDEQLRQAQKLEAIGQLAGGIAHDFNNLTTVVTGYSDLMLLKLKPGDPLCEDIEEIRKAAQRAKELTRQLMSFSRRQVIQPVVLDLNTLAADTYKMLLRLIGENIELFFVPAATLGLVRADPGQIEQVLMNLAVNARDAMPKGGKLVIETSDVELEEGRFVMIAVTDTGVGIDVSTQAQIFEPFFTTKAPGMGTGLGLATVRGVIKQSGGHVAVYSEPGNGATFKVYLPRVEGVAAERTGSAAPASRGGTETILIAEDEEPIRRLACRVLREKGYTVIEACDGAEAMRLMGETPGLVHLVLTDVSMPETSGRELVVRLAAQRPALKALFMSGYTPDAVVRRGVLEATASFLAKPFTAEALLLSVRRVLDESELKEVELVPHAK